MAVPVKASYPSELQFLVVQDLLEVTKDRNDREVAESISENFYPIDPCQAMQLLSRSYGYMLLADSGIFRDVDEVITRLNFKDIPIDK